MDRDYDIVEKLPDASLRVLIRVHGTRHVPSILAARGKETRNECFARNVRTGEILARVLQIALEGKARNWRQLWQSRNHLARREPYRPSTLEASFLNFCLEMGRGNI